MLWGGAAVSGHVGACLDVFGTGIAAAPFLNTVPISGCFNANTTVCCDPKWGMNGMPGLMIFIAPYVL